MTSASPTLPFETGVFDELAEAPNPKPTAADKRGFGKLASLYTSFSRDFARFILDQCLDSGHHTIADPFCGMGTLGEAGRGLPVHLVMNDLNPFAALASVFRTAPSNEILNALDLVQTVQLSSCRQDEVEVFRKATTHLLGGKNLSRNLSEHNRASLLAALIIGLIRTKVHGQLGGSNPTWMRRDVSLQVDSELLVASRSIVESSVRELAGQMEPLDPRFRADSFSSDVQKLGLGPASLDAIITSPPYPNRTDYIRHYLPAAELFLSSCKTSERDMRETQIGTPLIRTPSGRRPFANSVASILEAIRTHPSYASESYYVKGFEQYFDDMRHSISLFSRWIKPGGDLFLVLQDVHYKDLRVPVTDLILELAEESGFAFRARRDFRVQSTLSNMSPHSRRSGKSRKSFESVLRLSRLSR
ncbi:MAG: hypothetical protein ABL931_02955 [Usitatibacteraceae bacterium]